MILYALYLTVHYYENQRILEHEFTCTNTYVISSELIHNSNAPLQAICTEGTLFWKNFVSATNTNTDHDVQQILKDIIIACHSSNRHSSWKHTGSRNLNLKVFVLFCFCVYHCTYSTIYLQTNHKGLYNLFNYRPAQYYPPDIINKEPLALVYNLCKIKKLHWPLIKREIEAKYFIWYFLVGSGYHQVK